jgi:hypothetical protein
MPVSTASVRTLKTAGERIGPIWRRGGLLLWGLTSACSVTLLALLAGALWQAGHAEELLTSYGSSLALAILLLMVFSALTTCVERSAAQQAGRPLVLIPNEIQSHCSQWKKSGAVVTQISLHFHETIFRTTRSGFRQFVWPDRWPGSGRSSRRRCRFEAPPDQDSVSNSRSYRIGRPTVQPVSSSIIQLDAWERRCGWSFSSKTTLAGGTSLCFRTSK